MERNDWKILAWITGIFALFYFIPYSSEWFNNSVISGINLLNDYAKKHVLTCLVPALFIAGAIGVFIKKDKILKYMGADAKKYVSYAIASVSGTILAVCSCTILPLFAGIRKRGAGLGPAITFLFSGPAINVAAIFLTISVLGYQIGLARITASIILSILVGLTMHLIFREKTEKGKLFLQEEKGANISGKVTLLFFAMMICILIVNGIQMDKGLKYALIGILTLSIAGIALFRFSKQVRKQWIEETWNFSKLILPLLFVGIFIAGFIMPLLPEGIITNIVGQNTIFGNLVASIFGAFMYFSTLTEIPILQALIAKGMHSGPALSLLLAGPSLSLPNMLVIRGILGTKKTSVYVALVVVYSTIAGLIFGSII
ncbi:MAG: permease [Candidatus Nanoarchaeia archaeon]|nr:permease [Candidatus Nanoarchaeia archaeon]